MAEQRFVALMRGINVAGKNRVGMKDLAAAFEAAGARDVATLIQSGNVVFGATDEIAAAIPARVAQTILGVLGLRVPVILRNGAELRRVASANPFEGSADLSRLHVVFLADAPDAASVGHLDPRRSPPDEFVVRGREIYLHCPNGIGRSKLTNDYFDRTLRTTSTIRNWNTVRKLAELAG